MPISETRDRGFIALVPELQDKIIEYAVENCLHRKEKNRLTSEVELPKRSNSDLWKIARVNKRFQSSSSLKLALDGTKWWIRATEAKSFKSLKACIQTGRQQTPVDQEIYQAAVTR